MTVYTYKGKSAYIDDRLARELEENVIPDLKEDDTDFVFCIDGKERSGKSKFADNIAGFVASKLNIDYSHENFHLSPHQFRDGILNAKKRSIVVYDEAHKGMGSRRSLSEINNLLVDLMMEMGQKNLFVILVLPTFFMLDKYAALHRTVGLFHVYKDRKRDPKTNKRKRFWVYFNEKYKLQLYRKGKQNNDYNVIKFPPFRGTFLDQWIIDKNKYIEKKAESFKQHGKRETKAEKWLEERNKLIYALHLELKVGARNLKRVLNRVGIKLSETIIKKILVECEISKETMKTEDIFDENEENESFDDEEDPKSA